MNMNDTVGAVAVSRAGGKYLTFTLGNVSYGIAVLRIREIIRVIEITGVPQMPPHICGVINLRGKIVPVVDLRIKFGVGQAGVAEENCIIVVQVRTGAAQETLMGLVVDGVEEVLNISAADVEDPPEFGIPMDTSYLVGLAKVKGQVKLLLDVERVVNGDLTKVLEANLKADQDFS